MEKKMNKKSLKWELKNLEKEWQTQNSISINCFVLVSSTTSL